MVIRTITFETSEFRLQPTTSNKGKLTKVFAFFQKEVLFLVLF